MTGRAGSGRDDGSGVSPVVQPGDIVSLAAQDRRYADEAIVLRVTRVRDDLSRYYDGRWLWLEGVPVLPDGGQGPPVQVLARVAALPGGTGR